MKKYALPLALVAAVTLQACNQQSSTDGEETAEVALETSNARLSYGIAYGLGTRMAADNVPIDIDAFSAGLRDAQEGGEPRLTEEEIQAEMQAFQEKAVAEQQAALAAAGEANQTESEAFLTENASREGVVVTDSGLQYEVLEEGEGESPAATDTVEVHYTGTLVDGTEFDSSHKRGQPVSFGVNQVIPGWTEALQLMSPGAKWKLYIPAELAYGPAGAGDLIGPNSALVFEVELLSVQPREEADSAAEPEEG